MHSTLRPHVATKWDSSEGLFSFIFLEVAGKFWMGLDLSQDEIFRGENDPELSRPSGAAAMWDICSPHWHWASWPVDKRSALGTAHQIWSGGSSSELWGESPLKLCQAGSGLMCCSSVAVNIKGLFMGLYRALEWRCVLALCCWLLSVRLCSFSETV